jgi:hypothetical protein
MESFKARTREFRLNEPNTYERNLRGATIAECEEQYLFLLCAYDYVYNPVTTDEKLMFMKNYFFRKPSGPLVFETMWYINIGESIQANIDTLLVNPTVNVSLEGKNIIPPLFNAAKSPATGNSIFAASKALQGGVVLGGVANYNLFTKAIDIACSGYADLSQINHSLATGIVNNRDKPIPGMQRQRLVERYTTMRGYYNDQTLTKLGLIYR